MRVRIILLKIEDVFDVRAAESVYSLVIVADDADILSSAGEQSREFILALVGILILVDVDVFKLVLIEPQHFVICVKEFDGEMQKIIEVQRVVLPQRVLIHRVDLGDDVLKVTVGEFGERFGCQEIVFGAADVAENRARVVLFIVEAELPEDVPNKGGLLAGVKNSEVPVQSRADFAEFLDVAAENAGAGGVERCYP